MPSTGLGLRSRATGRRMAAHGPGDVAAITCDYLFGLAPAAVTDIPYLWLRRPLAMRQDPPTNDQRVTSTSGGAHRARNQASLSEHLTWPGDAIDLDTAVPGDVRSLAEFTTALHPDPRYRAPRLTFDLHDNTRFTDRDRQRLLRLGLGDRILITDAPATWPPGLARLTIVGIRHEIDSEKHLLIFNTSPMLGHAAGEVGPWFRFGASALDVGEPIPF